MRTTFLAGLILAAAAAAPALAADEQEPVLAGVPFVHGYKVDRLTTYDIDGRAVGHIDVRALPRDARPVAWGSGLVGIRALDGRVVFVCRNDLIIEDQLARG